MIIPAIELCSGKVVSVQPDGSEITLDEHPVALARTLYRYGEIAVIDLDAARGEGDNLVTIGEMCRVAECRVGGGILDEKRGDALLRAGARRLIIGTGADESLLAKFPRNKVLVAIDFQDGKVVRKGWSEATDIDPVALAVRLQQYCTGYIYGLVGHRLHMEPDEVERFERLHSRLPDHSLAAAGGFSTAEDVRALDRLGVDGQVAYGRHLEGIDLAEAFTAVLNFEQGSGLLPVIVQDTAGQVLSLVNANEEAVLTTLRSGLAAYWNPGRGKIWTKGQSSGNTHELVTIRIDCDRDALLYVVRPTGPSCHLGRYACFDDMSYNLLRIEQVMWTKHSATDPRKSYTQVMLADREGLKARIRAEAEALVKAEGREEALWETADLFYFVLLNLVQEGITLDEVFKELRGRAGRRRS